MATNWVVEAREPDPRPRALKRQIAVAQNADSVVGKGFRDLRSADLHVMVAEDSVDPAALEAKQDVGTLPGGTASELERA